jgi:hypothetical protein
VRSPANVAAAVAVTGRIGVHAEPATRYFPHPGVRYLPLDGPRAVVAIASRRRDRRDLVAAFCTAVLASGVVEQLAPLSERPTTRSQTNRWQPAPTPGDPTPSSSSQLAAPAPAASDRVELRGDQGSVAEMFILGIS